MRQRIILLFTILVAATLMMVVHGWAEPYITDVTGTFSSGQPVTITGSGFLTKSPATPMHWHNTDNDSPTYGSYYRAPTAFSASVTRRGAGTRTFQARRGGAGANDEISPWLSPTLGLGDKFFAYFWRRISYTPSGTDNIKMFFLNIPHEGRGPGIAYGCPSYNCAPYMVLSERCSGSGQTAFTSGHTANNWFNEIYTGSMSTSIGASNASLIMQFISAAGVRQDATKTGISHCSTASDDFTVATIDAYDTQGSPSGTQYIDSIYVDTTWARVMIGDNEIFTNCTHFEMLIPVTWNGNTNVITATFNAGTFNWGQSAYIFVIDENNDPSSGYMVTIGSSEEDILPPALSGKYPSALLPAGTTSAPVGFISDEPCTCRWSGTAGTAYANMANTFSTTGGTSHESTFSGLTDGSSQTIYARCIDGAGNPNTTDLDITIAVAEQSPATSYRIIKRGTVTVVVP